jgi:hypothetical protein
MYSDEDSGQLMPLSAQPNGCEAWVLLLEKAFAKYMGSYAAMDGGWQLAAFRCLAGDTDNVMYMTEEVRSWARLPVCSSICPEKSFY